MSLIKKMLNCFIISLLWLDVTACQAKTECECHGESAVEFVQVYYADLQAERADRISLALDRWYPNRVPNDQKFVEQVNKIQYVRAKATVEACWQESRSIVNIRAEMKTRDNTELTDITGVFYLKCSTQGWKIFLAQRDTESELDEQ